MKLSVLYYACLRVGPRVRIRQRMHKVTRMKILPGGHAFDSTLTQIRSVNEIIVINVLNKRSPGYEHLRVTTKYCRGVFYVNFRYST